MAVTVTARIQTPTVTRMKMQIALNKMELTAAGNLTILVTMTA